MATSTSRRRRSCSTSPQKSATETPGSSSSRSRIARSGSPEAMSSPMPTRNPPMSPSRRLPNCRCRSSNSIRCRSTTLSRSSPPRSAERPWARGRTRARRWCPRRSGSTGSAPRARPPARSAACRIEPLPLDQADRLVDLQVFHSLPGVVQKMQRCAQINGRQHHVNRHSECCTCKMHEDCQGDSHEKTASRQRDRRAVRDGCQC
jgi:hypothetical protein